MKIAVWVVCLLLLGFWTGGTLLLTALTGWGAQQLASGDVTTVGGAVAQWPVPAWATLWIDTAWIQAAQETLTWSLQALDGSLPMLGSVVAWIVPFLWVSWGLGAVLLLLLAGGAHLLLGRLQTPRQRVG